MVVRVIRTYRGFKIMTEIWKDISDYEGIYQISNLGRVKSFHKNNPQILKAHISPAGYYKIQLKMNNVCKCVYIHRLVAEAFVPNPDNLPEVNHKNENKLCNESWNLEWCTHSYNNSYGSKNDKNKKRVAKLNLNGDILKIYDYLSLVELDGYNLKNVSRVCRNKSKTHKGYKWMYI